MRSGNWERIKSTFHAVLALPDAERTAALARACGGDDALRSDVQELLAAHRDAVADGGLAADSADFGPSSQETGSCVGPYKLLQEIGEGGFGVVYMAEQQEPVRRRVALKILKAGMDSRAVIARFEAERQALAMMEHPNIARVFDAGTTPGGRPYFVMELVRGVPITDYCDANNLATDERLELFSLVCHAVQHAHQKGIIHRDIKPSNVLVTLHDDRPVPKVIDFGVAKATNQRLTEKTLFTEFRQLIGTPAYMSPEQAGISGIDVDTRSDIYSLGVLLYEILTGTQPFEPETLRGAAYDEILRVIREVEPPKPSTRVSSLGDSLREIAKHRGTEPASLGRLMRGDLDWIVMKALEKDRTRRYESAGELARDIARHRADDPVVAGPPSAGYRLRKFVRRNRTAVAWGGLAAAGVLLGLVVSTLGLVEAQRGRAQARRAQIAAQADAEQADQARLQESEQRQRAEVARNEAERARQEADQNRARAEAEAARASAVLRFLEDTLASADPLSAGGSAPTLASLLGGASARLDAGELAGEPLVEARVRATLGKTYLNLHLSGFEAAERHLRRASEIWLGEGEARSERAVRSLLDLADLKDRQDEDEEAERLYERALVLAREGGDGEVLEQALSSTGAFLKRCGEQDPRAIARAVDRFREALELAEERHGAADPVVALRMNDLASALAAGEEFEEAGWLFEAALRLQRELHDGPHADIAATLANLGNLERARENPAAAETYLRDAVAMHQRSFEQGRGDLESAAEGYLSLADLLVSTGRAEEAVAIHEGVLQGARDVFPGPHPLTAHSLRLLGDSKKRVGDFDGAETAYLEALEIYRATLGEEHQETVIAALSLGGLYASLERYAEAEPLLLAGYEAMIEHPGSAEADRRFVAATLGRLYQATERSEEASRWQARARSAPAE